jgi:hypothetical protein
MRELFFNDSARSRVIHPNPVAGRPSPQRNDIDDRGLIYLADRNIGFDILELRRRPDGDATDPARSFLGHSGLAKAGQISGFK